MKALDMADCLVDEGYGELTHKKEYVVTVRMNGRVVHTLRSWNGKHVLSWWEETQEGMRMTYEYEFEPHDNVPYYYKDTCRWVFQGLRP